MTMASEHPTSDGGTSAPAGPLRLRYSAVSDVGRHRKDNQDSGFASGRLLVVADGVGGQAFGDVASATAVHLVRRLERTEDDPDAAVVDGVTGAEDSLSALAGVVHRIHDRLAEMVEQDSELEGTSTTLTAALFDGSSLAFAHVGDSRAYLLRDGTLRQLTTDHTFVQTLIDEGRITEEESRVHPHRNIILKAVDGVHDSDPDLFAVDLQAGDRVMLCSDGCSGVLDEADIVDHLGSGTVDSAALDLVRASLDAGSTDNVTVVTAEVVEAATPDGEESAAAAVGPMLVGAAAAQPRRGMLSRIPFRRQHDTGELDPVDDEVDPEELRYAPRVPHHSRGLRGGLLVLLALLLLVGAAIGGYTWTQQQYYVAADGPQVAVYKGVQMDLPGVTLSEVYETSSLRVKELPEYDAGLVDGGIVADSLSDARTIVDNLEEAAARRARQECPDPQRTGSKDGDRKATATPQPSPEGVDCPPVGDGDSGSDDQPDDGPTSGPTAGPTSDATTRAGTEVTRSESP